SHLRTEAKRDQRRRTQLHFQRPARRTGAGRGRAPPCVAHAASTKTAADGRWTEGRCAGVAERGLARRHGLALGWTRYRGDRPMRFMFLAKWLPQLLSVLRIMA